MGGLTCPAAAKANYCTMSPLGKTGDPGFPTPNYAYNNFQSRASVKYPTINSRSRNYPLPRSLYLQQQGNTNL
jgi:hypothetical protein